MRTHLHLASDATACTTAGVDITWGADTLTYLDLLRHRVHQLTFRVKTATQALAGLDVYGKVIGGDDTWVPIITDDSDYSAGVNPRVLSARVITTATDAYVDTDVYNLATAEYAVVTLDVSGFSQLKITATSAASTATVTIIANGSPESASLSGSGGGGGSAPEHSEFLSASATEAAAGTEAVVAAPGEGKQIWVYGYSVTLDASGTWSLKSAATVKQQADAGANGGMVRDSSVPLFKCADNEALNFCPVTGNGDVNVTYRIVTV